MASGKTTVGRSLADALGRPFLDCDDLLTARTGETAAQIADRDGVDALHVLEAEVLLAALARPDATVITAAASTIEDAACRAALADAAVMWLRGDPAVLARRARNESHRPLAGDVEAQLRAQAERRDPLFAGVADITVDVD
ncbi:MAG: shikimate kinase [Actinomycetota bacterium]|jgi:shikimate kinase